ncbi:hypothetical protein Esi_0304_0016 [Ectocarpus siliculosus]|uniref:Uncharacterized protein n=1 Tax=Ectocarpus siliculosus TaxID=2880 RepID=D8LKQ9_ECTSI|nr:hypothetical protein Esi_0304_0016 [Ectocarpus siliculosus]|eukprot:CBN76094.1 hypothetical protein Esi_0304_0016 [Ectocarpus siliculosus]
MHNAVKMLMAKTGRGFRLKRENKTKLWTKKNEEEDSRRRNRWSYVSIKCCHGGKPRKRPRVEDASARCNSKSRKANLCLAHHTPTSGGKEHERPRAFDNGNGVCAEDIEEESDLIRRLHFSNVTTKEIHKALADIGKKLGPAGKQKVRSMRHTFDAGLTAKPPRRSTRGAAAGHPGQVPPVDDPNPIALPHAGPTSVSAYEYAHDGGVALGEELGAMFAQLTSVAAVQRVIENTKNFAEHLLEAEKRSPTTPVNDEPSAHPWPEEELSIPPAYRKGTPGVRGRCGTGRGRGGSRGKA